MSQGLRMLLPPSCAPRHPPAAPNGFGWRGLVSGARAARALGSGARWALEGAERRAGTRWRVGGRIASVIASLCPHRICAQRSLDDRCPSGLRIGRDAALAGNADCAQQNQAWYHCSPTTNLNRLSVASAMWYCGNIMSQSGNSMGQDVDIVLRS